MSQSGPQVDTFLRTTFEDLRKRAEIFRTIISGKRTFWEAVRDPFIARELRKEDVRAIIRYGLGRTGSYQALLNYFHMPLTDHQRLIHFLRRNGCYVELAQG
jgi:hypothetical protein